jgi:hypothetical protein
MKGIPGNEILWKGGGIVPLIEERARVKYMGSFFFAE